MRDGDCRDAVHMVADSGDSGRGPDEKGTLSQVASSLFSFANVWKVGKGPASFSI